MPDVIIKDMEMPKSCYGCDLANFFSDETPYCRRRMRAVTLTGKRPDWCPLRPAPEWIGVEERLPEEKGRYLVVTKTGMIGVAFHSVDAGFAGYVGITHWMPLPEPPEGGSV